MPLTKSELPYLAIALLNLALAPISMYSTFRKIMTQIKNWKGGEKL